MFPLNLFSHKNMPAGERAEGSGGGGTCAKTKGEYGLCAGTYLVRYVQHLLFAPKTDALDQVQGVPLLIFGA